MNHRRHERNYSQQGMRGHMKDAHGVRVGSIRLATFILHRQHHERYQQEHTHALRPECGDGTSCPCKDTHPKEIQQ